MEQAQVGVRLADSGDARKIADLLNRSFAVERDYIEDEPETEGSVNAAIGDGGYYLVSVDPAGLVGCVYVDLARRTMFKLAMEPTRRLRGYGRQLMTEAERQGKDAGWSVFTIGVLNFRQDLFDFYQKLGYVRTQRRGSIVGTSRVIRPCHIVVMTKPVA